MNIFLEKLTGMNRLSDQVIAMDLLLAAKSGARNYALAVTEAGTPEVKAMLQNHLNESIDMHERITNYLIQNGWYHPHNVKEQLQLDLRNMQTALSLRS